MVYRKLPQRLGQDRARIVFEAVMECRLAARQASSTVKRECPVDHALSGLVSAIDALCAYLTRLRREGDAMDIAMRDELRAPDRTNRPNVIEEPGLLLGELRACRDTLNSASSEVVVMGATYEAMQIVLAAIAALTMLLTGDRDYFSTLNSGATAGQKESEAHKRARTRRILMKELTYYVALPFHLTEDGQIVSGEPQECRDAGKAVRVATILAGEPANCGAIAFSRSGDPSLGDCEDAVIIRSFGEVDSGLA